MKTKNGAIEVSIGMIIVVFLSVLLFTLVAFSILDAKYKDIVSPSGNSSDYLINIVGCNIQNLSASFYIPYNYSSLGQRFGEKINETHGEMCWYDVIYSENLTYDWLDENCNKTYFIGAEYSCDEGFIVK